MANDVLYSGAKMATSHISLLNKTIASGRYNILSKYAHGYIANNNMTALAHIGLFIKFNEQHYITAINNNNTTIFMWLYGQGCIITINVINLLIINGKYQYIRKLHKRLFPFRDTLKNEPNVIDMALVYGKSNIAIYLHHIRAADISQNTLYYAVNTGDRYTVRYFARHGAELHSNLYIVPINNGWKCIVELLLDIGCPFDESIVNQAYDVFMQNGTEKSKIIIHMFDGLCSNCAMNKILKTDYYKCPKSEQCIIKK